MLIQIYWRVVDRLAPRSAQPLDLSTVLLAVDGRVVCPADTPLCTFHIRLFDNEVLQYLHSTVCATYRQQTQLSLSLSLSLSLF